MIPTFVFLFCLFVTYFVYLLSTRSVDARRAQLERRVQQALQDSDEAENGQLVLTRRDTLSKFPALARLLARFKFTQNLDHALSQADIQITVGRLLFFCILAGIMAGLAALTVFESLAMVVISAVVAAALPIVHVKWVRKRRLAKFLEHLPDALDLMSRSLAVGHAFSEALYQVAEDMPEPISREFRLTYEEQKLGLSTKLALEHLGERIPLLDLHLCITAILIQRETGGNLAEILEKVATTIRERFRLMEEFRTMTTASRGSAWILCALPFFIVFVIMAFNPSYMNPLFYDPRGHYILAVAALLQVLGIITIRKILAIKI
jgi:tight adherence protein B